MTADSDRECVVSRRGLLRYGASIATGATTLTTTSGVVRGDHPQHRPEHVSLSFPRNWLETYRPRLDLHPSRDNPDDSTPEALFAWRASSTEHETDVAVYWAAYTFQAGKSPFGTDSHYGDREPVYVFVENDTGEITEVVYSAYHHLRGRITDPPVYDGTHPEFMVVTPWHHYSCGTVRDGEFVDVESLGTSADLDDPSVETEFETWLSDDGFHGHLAPGTVVNPWQMGGATGRQHWWREGRDGINLNRLYYSAILAVSNRVPYVNYHSAAESDTPQ